MIGVQFTSCGFRIVHTNVVADEPNSRSTAKAYKCLMCGAKWVQNINAPLLMSSKEYEEREEKHDVVCYRLNGK